MQGVATAAAGAGGGSGCRSGRAAVLVPTSAGIYAPAGHAIPSLRALSEQRRKRSRPRPTAVDRTVALRANGPPSEQTPAS